MESNIAHELEVLIRARYPIILVESYEEGRAVGLIHHASTHDPEYSKKVLVWSATTGITTVDGKLAGENTNDPMSALQYIQEDKEKSVIIMKDLHRYVDDNLVYRKLRDLHTILKSTQKTICILTPVTRIPVELQKAVTVVSLPLPQKEDLEAVLKTSIDTLQTTASAGNPKALTTMDNINNRLNTNGYRDSVLSAGLGLTLDEFEDVVMKSFVDKHDLDIGVIVSEKEQIIRKSGILEFYTSLADMQDVGGLNALKTWIQKRKLAFTKKAVDYGLRTPKGVFLAGPPGTGKSLTAKVIAKYMQMPLLRLDMSKIFASHVGESEQNITAALKISEAVAPSVLWLDEVEKALAGTQSSGQLDSGVTARVFGTILTWMQEHTAPVFLVATSNNPLAIPPEFMRAGRFDEVFFVDLPSEQERREIVHIHIHKVKRNPDLYEIYSLASSTDGFSGAEIEAAVQDALYNAFFDNEELNDRYLAKAVASVVPLSKKRKEEVEALRRWGKINATNASIEETEAEKLGRQIDL